MSSKERRISEVWLQNELTFRLGYEGGTRVRFTSIIRNQKDIDQLGISHHYIFCVIRGRGVKAKTYYGSANAHGFLKAAIVKETGCGWQDLRAGQIGFQRKQSGAKFGETIILHEPLSSGRIAKLAELRCLVGGIQRNLWSGSHIFIRDGNDQFSVFYPAEGRFELY